MYDVIGIPENCDNYFWLTLRHDYFITLIISKFCDTNIGLCYESFVKPHSFTHWSIIPPQVLVWYRNYNWSIHFYLFELTAGWYPVYLNFDYGSWILRRNFYVLFVYIYIYIYIAVWAEIYFINTSLILLKFSNLLISGWSLSFIRRIRARTHHLLFW